MIDTILSTGMDYTKFWSGLMYNTGMMYTPWLTNQNLYWKAKYNTGKLEWSPNTITINDGKTSLRCFRENNEVGSIIIVAPEAGHSSIIADYGPKRSLVQCALENYSGGVYVVDKLPAKPEHADYGAEYNFHYLDVILNWFDDLPGDIHLVGLCQGGWQSAVVAARTNVKLSSLTIAAAPIDFHAGNSFITDIVKHTPDEFYEGIVKSNKGLMPGSVICAGFVSADPQMFWRNELNLYANADDPRAVDRYQRFTSWYLDTQPIPGKLYLDAVSLFRNNNLCDYADLSNIDCHVNMVTGKKDKLTPEEQTIALKKHCPEARHYEVDAGHIGVFMSSKGIVDVWSNIFKYK